MSHETFAEATEHMNANQLRKQFAQAKEQLQEAPAYMRPAKTAAQSQPERKAREL